MQSQKHLWDLQSQRVILRISSPMAAKSVGWGWAAIAPRFRGLCARTLCAVLYSMLEMETSLWFDLACTEVSSVLEDLALGFKIKQKADFQTFSDQDYLKNRLVPTSFFFRKPFDGVILFVSKS